MFPVAECYHNVCDLSCTLDNRATGIPMPAVTFDGAVVEQTIHPRHLGIHFDRMLTHRHVETAAKSARKVCQP